MKKFLIKISLSVIILYGLAWVLDYMVSKGIYRMEDYRFMSWSEVGTGDINADVLILGNSRALSHFEPWTIDSITGMSCYNLGLGGYPINVELMKYNYYRHHNRKPSLIVFQADYMTIKCLTAPHQHQSEQFLPLIYDRPMHDELRNVGYNWLDLHCPMYRYWGYQITLVKGLTEYLGIKHHIDRPTRMGLFYETDPWDGTELAKMDTIHAVLDEEGRRIFEGWMARCAEEGVNVLLVNSPMYKGATDKLVGEDVVNAYFDSIANIYHTEYWNYTENYELCNDTANFVVSVHMNPQATHQFSIDFANRLNEYSK